MRYAYTMHDVEIRQELFPEQIAKLTAAGIALAILHRYHYIRGAEPHVGEYTDAEHAGMLALGWTLVKLLAEGEDVAPPPPEPGPTEAEALATAHPDAPAEVRAALAELVALVGIGVAIDLSGDLPGWPIITAAIAAAKAQATTLAKLRALCAHADAADGHWRAVVTWTGDYATAYRLAPELAAMEV